MVNTTNLSIGHVWIIKFNLLPYQVLNPILYAVLLSPPDGNNDSIEIVINTDKCLQAILDINNYTSHLKASSQVIAS